MASHSGFERCSFGGGFLCPLLVDVVDAIYSFSPIGKWWKMVVFERQLDIIGDTPILKFQVWKGF